MPGEYEQMRMNYERNKGYAVQGNYMTDLGSEEPAFQDWVKQNQVPFDVKSPVNDYDMRGFWKATKGKGWKAGDHFPDTFKTPYHETFSNESQWAMPNAPRWLGEDLMDQSGKIIFGPSKDLPRTKRPYGTSTIGTRG